MNHVLRRRIWIFVPLVLAAAVAVYMISMRSSGRDRYTVYIGGYGSSAVKCIFNPNTNELVTVRDYKAENPSYLAVSGSGRKLWGVSESGSNSGVWGYDDASDKSLGVVRDKGADPCYVLFYKGHLFTANYGKGGVSVYSLDTAGNINPPHQIINFVSEANPTSVSRNHQVIAVKTKRSKWGYLLSADKGLDCIHLMRIGDDTSSVETSALMNGSALRLYKCNPALVNVPKGYGPRHFALSPDSKFLYLLCETSGHILAYSIEERGENLILKQIQDTLSDYSNAAASADLHISPDGKFLYASHRRGKDGIAIFQIGDDGLISRIAYQVTDQWPRSFAITPDGDFMFVCCQKDRSVQTFRIDKRSGYLIYTGKKITFPDLEPSCVKVRLSTSHT